MRKFFVLVKKEVKELLTPQILAPLFISVLLFIFLGKVIGTEGKKMEAGQSVTILDLDESATSRSIVEMLSKSGFKPELYEDKSVKTAIRLTHRDEGTVLLVFPQGFEQALTDGKVPQMEAYTILRSFSFSRLQAGGVSKALAFVNDYVGSRLILSAVQTGDLQRFKNPVKTKEHVIIGEKMAVASLGQITGFIMSQTTFIPIVLFLVIILAAQMVATAVATEKENKTLETLLSTPVNRSALALAKMVAAGLLALLAAAVYLFSFRYYMQGIMGVGGSAGSTVLPTSVIKQLGLVLSPGDYVLLGLSLFLGILSALAIAIILGVFAEEVKGVQALMTPLMILVLIPYVLVMFLDLNSGSSLVRYLVFAIPFSHPFLAISNLFLRNYGAVLVGIVYEAFFFAVFVYIAGRIFSSDRILTMKIRLKRRTA